MAPNNKKKVRKKCVQLSVVQKLELVEKLEQGISAKDICNMYGIHRQTLSNIKKSKPKLQKFALTHNIDSSELHASTIGNKIRLNFGRNKNLDKALYEWYSQQKSSGIDVQQHQLRSEFSALVTRMRLRIKCTKNWLCHFKTRHGIMDSLLEAPCSEPSESEKKNSTEDKVIPEEPIKVENLPSSSSSPPTTSTRRNISKLNASTIGNKIRMNFGPNENLDKALYEWYSQRRSSGINVQQHQLRSEFSALVTRMRLSIKGTKHWLYHFKKRHGIMGSLHDASCSEPSESEKKNSTEDKVIPEEPIKVENLPSSSSSPPTTSTRRNISKLNASTIGNKIRMNFGPNGNLDKALYEWYSQQRSSGINVQQHQLRSEFSALVTRMRLSIKCTKDWLYHFKTRHGIMGSLRDASYSELSESEKKNSTEDKVIPEEPIKVENLPSSSSSPPTTSTRRNISKLNASTIGNKIRMNFGPNENLDKALYEWYSQQRSSGINVQQVQLRSEFSALVTRMRLSIKRPVNWLYYFKKRHGIMDSLRKASCSEPSESEKKNSTEDKVIPEELIKVENLPSLSSSPPTTSTPTKNFGESVKVENFSSEPCLSQTDVYQNYVWSEYDIKSEGSPSP